MIQTQIPSYFKARRDRLVQANRGSVFILPSNPHPLRNPDVEYPFRQESSFYYLTGFEEPHSCLVITADGRSVLFVMVRDKEREIWNGERYGVDRALKTFQVNETYPIGDFEKKLPDLLKNSERVYYRLGLSSDRDRTILTALDQYRASQGRTGMGLLPVLDPIGVIGEMRLFKSQEEIEIMRKAGKASALAHKFVMENLKPGMNEFEIQNMIESQFYKNGCRRLGYGSIVAGGKNSTCLHYVYNNEPLRDGDLILIDAGGEVDYYTADITRTFPVGKSFSPAQAEIYDLVLGVQKKLVAMCRPGIPYGEIHKTSVELLTEGLLSLGVLSGNRDEIIKKEEFKKYFPHGTGHYLGMDVHDVGLYKIQNESRKLEPGMVFTIEPGIYFQMDDSGYPEKYRGIGIRIEDNILITQNGHENLTIDAPKERADIEKLKK